jgi:hypothetical protein
MTQFTSPLAQTSCRWTPEQIAAKQAESMRLVRERIRQEKLDGGSGHSKATTTEKVRRQLLRLRKTWSACQRNRNRDAIYKYLGSVYELVARWRSQGQVVSRARRVRMLMQKTTSLEFDLFALLIEATSDLKKVDRKMRSKWSRVLRFAEKYKPEAEPLKTFIKYRGGINACAALYARHLGVRHQCDEMADHFTCASSHASASSNEKEYSWSRTSERILPPSARFMM